ncbi:hypothetical protein [Croceicoccus naphthovorans]|uniref:Uncharacterized protein n=1 Tax=Croceicoccus naphthovorans TaxID=1348774 RepID=A0A0G3XEK4_9SPHN|nr:hypothetical protein [Croceicoccus naphthovorans]AKM09046.1 hypothetical protein AB433_02190 [Croceicoccus naphthovorans]MBB3991453.1 protein tyrosine phosphatase (PTP) superfamily phosphohydrolase (DUF442 family) [Croceicoccus naphthovorans]
MTDPVGIRAWQRLDARTTTSGAPTADDIAALAGICVRHVINLALPGHPEILPDEGKVCGEHGIAYTAIPIPFDHPTEQHYRQFRAAIAGNDPVHVHCVMNWRVSALFYRSNVENGMDRDKALAMLTRQWDPRTADNPAARAWASLIGL